MGKTTRLYPIVIKMNSKEIQIGNAKVEFDYGDVINSCQKRHDAILKDIKLNFKEGDWIANVLSRIEW